MPRRPLLLAAGAGCLAAVLGLGLAVRQQAGWLDRAVPDAARPLLPPESRLVQVLSSEAGWPPGALLMTLLPLAAAAGFLVREIRRHGFPAVADRWRWLLPALAVLPVLYVLRVAFGRPGPGEVAHDGPLYVGAYPSGAAVAIGLGWTVGVLVVGAQWPRWRPWLLAAMALALVLHLLVRAVTGKHWATDILGSYLLAAGAFLLAAASRGRPGG
jgi:membrane-associated phospholipid phosphatase